MSYPQDVLIQVAYAALNYKDALVCIPRGGVARTYPLVPGLELTGVVVESTDARFQPGERVLASDYGSTQGVSRHGGYSEYARVPGDFIFPMPEGMGFKQALVSDADDEKRRGDRGHRSRWRGSLSCHRVSLHLAGHQGVRHRYAIDSPPDAP